MNGFDLFEAEMCNRTYAISHYLLLILFLDPCGVLEFVLCPNSKRVHFRSTDFLKIDNTNHYLPNGRPYENFETSAHPAPLL